MFPLDPGRYMFREVATFQMKPSAWVIPMCHWPLVSPGTLYSAVELGSQPVRTKAQREGGLAVMTSAISVAC